MVDCYESETKTRVISSHKRGVGNKATALTVFALITLITYNIGFVNFTFRARLGEYTGCKFMCGTYFFTYKP